ncbi:MAG TPA: type II toxin-antitoxin system prevent-host-death family antitoxin [Saprospiraceae bacterium]|nr:type II toxin-antitoxin system prevent-host-death family antitoxin [Saprospiraceae bacterium]
MEIVNMHEAKTNLSKLAQKVINGERVIISKNNEPIMELVPYKEEPKRRSFGTLKGQISFTDDFWEADEEIIKLVEESKLFPDEDNS